MRSASYQMRLLSVAAISFVIIGHLNFPQYYASGAGLWGRLFPYYSFHLPLFLFISGYYFRDPAPSLKGFCVFVLRKARKLLLPYYIVNGFFFLLGIYLTGHKITFLQQQTFTQFLVNPWIRPFTVTFSVPSWYLIALFIAEIYFDLLHRLLRSIVRSDFARELVMLLLSLALGIAAVHLQWKGLLSPAAVVYLRSVVMLFFLEVGRFYRLYLASRDTLVSSWYFLIVLVLQCMLVFCTKYLTGEDIVSPGLFALENFGATGYVYFLGGLTGIALWLRICCLAAAIPHQSRFLIFIGQSTKYIMCFHVFGFFLLNTLFYVCRRSALAKALVPTFDRGWYRSYLYYCCTDDPRIGILYFIAGMGLGLLVAGSVRLAHRHEASNMRHEA